MQFEMKVTIWAVFCDPNQSDTIWSSLAFARLAGNHSACDDVISQGCICLILNRF